MREYEFCGGGIWLPLKTIKWSVVFSIIILSGSGLISHKGFAEMLSWPIANGKTIVLDSVRLSKIAYHFQIKAELGPGSSIAIERKEQRKKRQEKPRLESDVHGVSIFSQLQNSQSVPWVIVIGITLLTILPAILLAMTPLVRLLVVFHFLRQALGTQTAPSNQVLMGLGLMMTWFLERVS